MMDQQRLEAFEKMLHQIEMDYAREKELMDQLKAQGKEKSATYRQYMGNRLMYTQFLAIYQAYGLRENGEEGGKAL